MDKNALFGPLVTDEPKSLDGIEKGDDALTHGFVSFRDTVARNADLNILELDFLLPGGIGRGRTYVAILRMFVS